MRLLFDEHYAKDIPEQLRASGHDAVGVTERPELIGLQDERLFELAAAEERTIVTENWAHFSRLIEQSVGEGTVHFGVIFTSRARLPRGRNTIGLYVRAFDAFLRAHPADDALFQGYRWLP